MDRRDELESPPGYNTDLMSYYSLEDVRPRDDGVEDVVGASVGAEVGFRPEDGAKVYVKDVTSRRDDTVQSHVAADIYGNHIPSVTPEIAYDSVYGKILMEEMPGEFTEDYHELEQRSFHRAVAEKLLLGDCDYGGNFLETENHVVPIDYDVTGRDLVTARETIETALGDDLDGELLNTEASRLAEKIDLRALEEDLRDENILLDRWSSREEVRDPEPMDGLFIGSIDNILDNVRAFQY